MEKIMNNLFKKHFKTTFFLYISYIFILIFSICIGYFLPQFLNENLLSSIYQKIALHFETPIYAVNDFSSWINVSLKYAFPDIVCIFIIFLFSFSSSNSIISGIILAYMGIKSGCEASLVCLTYTSNIEYTLKTTELFVFFALKILLISLCIRYIYYTLRFYSTYIAKPSSPASILKIILSSLLRICSLLAIYGVYCFIIKII